MSNNKVTPVVASSSIDSPGVSSGQFFVATYKDHNVAIKRDQDYADTLVLLRKAFPALGALPSTSQIRLLAQFSEFSDLPIEINEDLWQDIMPALKFVQVLAEGGSQQDHSSTIISRTETPTIKGAFIESSSNLDPKPVTIHVRDSGANIIGLNLPLFSTTTIRELKDIVAGHDDRLPRLLLMKCEGYPSLEDHKQLQDYGISDGGEITMMSEFTIYVIGRHVPKTAVTVAAFTTVRFLKVLAFSVMDADAQLRLLPHNQILMCAGDILDDSRKLGSYSQVVPGCEIYVNGGLRLEQHTADYSLFDLRVRKQLSLGRLEDMRYKIIPGSTVVDMKLLIANTTGLPTHCLLLQDSSQERLYDTHTIKGPASKGAIDVYLIVLAYNSNNLEY